MTGSMYSPIPVDNRRTLGPICDYIIKVNFPDILDMDSDPYE